MTAPTIVLRDAVIVIIATDEHTLTAYGSDMQNTIAYAKRHNHKCIWHVHQRVTKARWREVATVRGNQPEEQQQWLLRNILRALAE